MVANLFVVVHFLFGEAVDSKDSSCVEKREDANSNDIPLGAEGKVNNFALSQKWAEFEGSEQQDDSCDVGPVVSRFVFNLFLKLGFMFSWLLVGHKRVFLLFLRGNNGLHILLLLDLLFFDDRPQFEEKFSAECSQQKNDEYICDDRRDEIVKETADGWTEEDVRDYYAHDVVID